MPTSRSSRKPSAKPRTHKPRSAPSRGKRGSKRAAPVTQDTAQPSSPRELLGRWVGAQIAPLAAAGSRLRHARVLHPDGMVFRAEVVPSKHADAVSAIADALAGHALVRFSSAAWRGGDAAARGPDILGCAVRFTRDRRAGEEPAPSDQDILFATLRHVWTLLLAPFRTRVTDYLANDYYAVVQFDLETVGRFQLRVRTDDVNVPGRDRAERLAHAVARGAAALHIEARLAGASQWRPVCDLRMTEAARIDQAALRFWPFRTGRGLVPRGFINAMRRAVYRASQRGRPLAR